MGRPHQPFLRDRQRLSRRDPQLDDFRLIDRDWRVSSHRLKQTRGLPTDCFRFLNSIGDLDSQLCGVFNIELQIDRHELQRLATRLSSDYDHLLQNVYYLVRGQRDGRELITQGQQLQAMIAQSSALISRGSYDEIVSAYQQSTKNGEGFSHQLSKLRDERLRHAIADIETTERLIHEQLWLPIGIDREYLAGMASGIAADAIRVFDSISLTKLMTAKQPGISLTAAREFQHACVNFSNGVSSGASLEDLEWDFRLFEVQWIEIHDRFHEFDVAEVDNLLEKIQFSMDTLKRTFGNAPAMDPGMTAQLTANLNALCHQTSRDVHARCIQPRYDNSFQNLICGAADQLSQPASSICASCRSQTVSIPPTI